MSEKVHIPVAFDAAKTLPKRPPINHKTQSALTIFFLTLSAAETLVFWLIVRPTFNELKDDFGVFVSVLIFVIIVVGMKLGMRYGPNLSSNTNDNHISGQVFVRLVMVPITVMLSVLIFHGATFIAYQVNDQHHAPNPRVIQIVHRLNTWIFVIPIDTQEDNGAFVHVGNRIPEHPPLGNGFMVQAPALDYQNSGGEDSMPLVIVEDSHDLIIDNAPLGNGFISTDEEEVPIYVQIVDVPPVENDYTSPANKDEQVQIAIEMATTINNQYGQIPAEKLEQAAITSFNPTVEENSETVAVETGDVGLLDIIVENPVSVVDDLVNPPATEHVVETPDEIPQPEIKYEQPTKTPDGSDTNGGGTKSPEDSESIPNNGNPGQGNDKPVGNAGEIPPGQAGN